MKRAIQVVLLIVAVVLSGLLVREFSDPQRPYRESGKYPTFALEGKEAPPFEAKIMGADDQFTRDSVDKPTLFAFFGTFCPHCKTQMPSVATLATEYDGKAHVFAVNAREFANMPMDEREQRVATYMEENGWKEVPTLLAPSAMQSALSIAAVPTVMVFDAKGRITYVGLASHTTGQLRAQLDKVL